MKAIRHTGIVVKDMAKALHFYQDLLGFRKSKQMEESGIYIDTICGSRNVKVTTVKLAADDGNLIELLCFKSPPPGIKKRRELNDFGFSHVSFTVDDIDDEFKRLSKAGVKFNSLPQKSPDGYARVAFCRDSEGNYIELVEVSGDK
jgi:catechol 2,3-dioxygenase-like lactoylglutathione lyase family enzyme